MVDAALAVAAGVLAALVFVISIAMLCRLPFDGLGRLGVFALMFPLHLLLLTAAGVVLAVVAWSLEAGAGAWLAVSAAAAAAALALWPAISLWGAARRRAVRLSLWEYLVHSGRPAFAGPQPQQRAVYATTDDGIPLELDIWPAAPSGSGTAPAMVRVHGGGWVGGARGEAWRWTLWLNQLGYTVFDVAYRLPPPARWRDETADVKAALAWVHSHTRDHGVDPARISVMGHSAGGNLALLAAYSRDGLFGAAGPSPPVRCVVNFYGASDLLRLHHSSGSRRYVQECLGRYIGGSPTTAAERYRLVSPLHHVLAGVAPTFTVLGTRDRIVPVDQAGALADALSAAGVSHETSVLPATDHSFDLNWGGFATQVVRARLERFLRQHG